MTIPEEAKDVAESAESTLRTAQTRAEDSAKAAGILARKTALAAVGLAGMAYDGAMNVWGSAVNLLERAEKRGEQIEQDFGRRAAQVEEQAVTEARKISDKARRDAHAIVQNVSRKVDEQLQQVKQSTGAAGSEQTAEPQQDIAVVSEEASEEMVHEAMAAVDEALIEPLDGYATMSVDEIMKALEPLGREQLDAVRTYELAGAQREEIVQEIESRIASLETDQRDLLADA